jgi:hypothetical protein
MDNWHPHTVGLWLRYLLWCPHMERWQKDKRTERVEERLRRVLEMDESQHAIGSEGVMARLQGAFSRYNPESKEGGSSPTKKLWSPTTTQRTRLELVLSLQGLGTRPSVLLASRLRKR